MGRRSFVKGVFSPAHGLGLAAFLLSGGLLFFRTETAALPLAMFVLSCLLAPFFPGVGFFLPVISRGRAAGKAAALTFDDGPDPEVIFPLLALLQRYETPATFFVVGKMVEGNPALLREILSRGHSIGNHSYHHDPFLMLRSRARLTEEITRTQRLLADFGIRARAFRPPVGITNPRLPGVLRGQRLDCVTFSCRAGDFGNRRIGGLAKTVLKGVHPGAIILLHDVSPPGAGTVQAWLQEVEGIILGLGSRGYRIIPLSVLIGRPVMERIPAESRLFTKPP
jgi:peptidoglycan/xylan/chitin deacetylase (PgdA/CDA1 family)